MGDSGRMHVLFSDEATLELRVQNAAYDVQYLGPYSRFGWNHPGPMYFYLLLPFYLFSGLGTGSLFLGALFINIIAVATILYYVYRSGSRGFFYLTAFFLALYIYFFLGFITLRSIWNPMVTILPFGALVLMSVYMGLGHIRTLPVMVFFATFVVQTHIAYGPVVLLVGLNALVLYILEQRPRAASMRELFTKEVQRALVFASVVLVVLWILPITEQFTNPPGNLYKIAFHFASSEAAAGHNVSASLAAVSDAVNAPLAALINGLVQGAAIPAGHWSLLAIHLLGLVISMAYHFKTGRKYFAYLPMLGLGILLVSVASVTRITGTIFPYLTKWISFIGLVNWLCIGFTGGSALWSWIGKRQGIMLNQRLKRIASYALVTAAAVGLLAAARTPVSAAGEVKRDQPEARIAAKITKGIKAYIRRANLPHFKLALRRDLWPIEAGVVNQLYKSSIPFSLEEEWLFWFGYQFRGEDAYGSGKKGQAKKTEDILIFQRGGAHGKDTDNRSLVYRLGQISIIHVKRVPTGSHRDKGN